MSFGIVPLQSSSSTTDILHAEVDYNLNEPASSSSTSKPRPLSSQTQIGINLKDTNESGGDISRIDLTTNENKKNSQEGYETLTIRAKLRQKVGTNRTKHVTLRDIDSIMRNVVTVVQNEFMKQFPPASTVQQISNTDE